MKIAIVHSLQRGGAYRRLEETVRYMPSGLQEFALSDADCCTSNPIVVNVLSVADRLPHLLRPVFRYVDFALRRIAYFRLGRRISAWSPDSIFMNPCRKFKSPTLRSSHLRKTVFWLDELHRSLEMDEFKNTTRSLTRPVYAPLRYLVRRANRRVIGQTNVVMTSSHYMGRLISDVYHRDVLPEYCGVSREFTCSGDSRDGAYVISVGSLIPGKGHDLVIQGLGMSGLELSLVIVTHRPNEDEIQRLKLIADSVGVEVTFQFGVSDAELATLYRGAIFTAYLATLEPFGLVSIESQACGTPALVSREGGLPETIKEGRTGRSTPRTVEDVAQAMREVASWSGRTDIKQECCEFGATWDWKKTAESVLRQLENVAR